MPQGEGLAAKSALGLGGTGFASVHMRFASQKGTGKASTTPNLSLDAALETGIRVDRSPWLFYSLSTQRQELSCC